MAIQLQPEERNVQRIVDSIIQLVQGRQNSIGDVTLALNSALTVVPFENCSKGCRVFLFPQSAAGAAVVASTYVDVADIAQGSFTIRHASSATAGRRFSFLCIGG